MCKYCSSVIICKSIQMRKWLFNGNCSQWQFSKWWKSLNGDHFNAINKLDYPCSYFTHTRHNNFVGDAKALACLFVLFLFYFLFPGSLASSIPGFFLSLVEYSVKLRAIYTTSHRFHTFAQKNWNKLRAQPNDRCKFALVYYSFCFFVRWNY